jgi:putative membrane protein
MPDRLPEAVPMMYWGVDGWIWMIVWIAGLLGMVWLIVRNPSRPSEADAMEILRARFARGEVTRDEFEQAREVLLDHR